MDVYANAMRIAQKFERGKALVERREKVFINSYDYEFVPGTTFAEKIRIKIKIDTYVTEGFLNESDIDTKIFLETSEFPNVSDDMKFLMGATGIFAIASIEVNQRLDIQDVMVLYAFIEEYIPKSIQSIIQDNYSRVIPIFCFPDFNSNTSLIFMNRLVSAKTLENNTAYLIGDDTENIIGLWEAHKNLISYWDDQDKIISPEYYEEEKTLEVSVE